MDESLLIPDVIDLNSKQEQEVQNYDGKADQEVTEICLLDCFRSFLKTRGNWF